VLYREQAGHIRKMLDELTNWMDAHNFANLDAFRGKLGQKQGTDAWSFARASTSRPWWAWISLSYSLTLLARDRHFDHLPQLLRSRIG